MRELYARGFEGNPHSRTIVIEQVVGDMAVVRERWPYKRKPLRMTIPLAEISKGAEGRGVTLEWLVAEGWEPEEVA